jgi:hypothetical protein
MHLLGGLPSRFRLDSPELRMKAPVAVRMGRCDSFMVQLLRSPRCAALQTHGALGTLGADRTNDYPLNGYETPNGLRPALVGGHSAQPATVVVSIDRDRRRIHRDRHQTEPLGSA